MKAITNFNQLSIKELKTILQLFKRDDLRKLAGECEVPRGRVKSETIHNLCAMKDSFDLRYLRLSLYLE